MLLLFGVCLGIGVLYAIFVLIGGGLTEVDAPDMDLTIDAPDVSAGDVDLGGSVKIPAISPVAIASFVTSFGGIGLIAHGLFELQDVWSLVVATLGSLVVAALAHYAFITFLIKPQGSSEVTLKDIVGALAEVTTPIPADSVGEIAFVAQGGRVSWPAKSATGEAIKRNTTVVIERLVGGVAFVHPYKPEHQGE